MGEYVASDKTCCGVFLADHPSPTMSLRDLIQHAHRQTSILNKNMDSFTAADSDWDLLRDSLWGKELASLELSPMEAQELASLEDGEPLPGVAPTTHSVVKIPETMPHIWDLDSQYILGRSEYEEAERAAVFAGGGDADSFLVTGQPGNGLTPLIPYHLWNLTFDQEYPCF